VNKTDTYHGNVVSVHSIFQKDGKLRILYLAFRKRIKWVEKKIRGKKARIRVSREWVGSGKTINSFFLA